MNLRAWLYRIARWMGDYRAIRRGDIEGRLVRRGLGHVMGRLMGQLFRMFKL